MFVSDTGASCSVSDSGISMASSLSPKSISVNVGVSMMGMVMFEPVSSSKSKSAGNGNSPVLLSGVFSDSGIGGCGVLNADALNWLICWRARIKAPRISFGILVGILCVSDSGTGVGAGASISGALGVAGRGNIALNIFVIYVVFMVTIGCWVRIISTVVAIYIGIAAKINMPNTNPANPCTWARANICHWATENILKLNMNINISHTITV